jgi:hypothetical protein
LTTAKPEPAEVIAAIATQVTMPRRQRSGSSQPLIWGVVLAVLIIIGGAVLYLRGPSQAPAPQVAMQAPPAAAPVAQAPPAAAQASQPIMPPAPPPAASQAPTPALPPPAPQAVAAASSAPANAFGNPDDAAWASTLSSGASAPIGDYLKQFPAGAHVQEAQLRMADLIHNDPSPSKAFDGAWQTTWVCSGVGQYPGYTYQFLSEIKDGVYHGIKGVKGEPSSLVMEGKVEADGMAGFSGEVIVGSSIVGLGVARGTEVAFHALAKFDHASGSGKRIGGRPCTMTFIKQ